MPLRRREWRRIALAFAWLAIGAAPVAAGVTAHLEPEIVDELETTRLVLRVSGDAVETPDLTPLSADFEILGTQTASQYRSTNGVVDAFVEYLITLRPTRTGELTIPPIAIGAARSPPLTLVARPIDPALRAAIDRMVFFEVELTRNPVYLRGETVLVRRLYYSSATQIYSDLPPAPELPDALVLPIGDTRSTTAIRDGERYGVIEQRFAIYPERTGTLTIPPISLTSSVRLQVDGRNRRSGVRVSAPSRTVEVLPIPPEYPADTPWLPASAVELRDDWSPDRATLQVGEPLQRRITVAVAGNLAAAIAPPDDRLPERHFRQYPEPASLQDDRSGHSVTGTRRTAYAIVPTGPGTVELPGLAITWWDVDARTVRTTRTVPRTLSIAGTATRTIELPAADQKPVTPAAAAPDAPPVAEETHPDLTPWRWAWWGVLVVIVAATLLVVTRSSARRTAAHTVSQALERAGLAGTARGLGRQRRLRQLRAELGAYARRGDVASVERTLRSYLACWYRTTPAHAFERFRADGAAALIDQLEAARFGTGSAQPPAAEALRAALDRLRAPATEHPDPLPPLFDRA